VGATGATGNTGVTLNNVTPTVVVAEAASVTVAPGQKVIIWTSVEYAVTSDGSNQNVTQTITDQTLVPIYDFVIATALQGGSTGEVPSATVVARVVELTGLVGTFTFQVLAIVSGVTPIAFANNASIVVMVVSE